MRRNVYGVLGRTCFPCRRVTLVPQRHATSRFSTLEQRFNVPSSTSDSRSPKMSFRSVSSKELPSAESCQSWSTSVSAVDFRLS